MTREESRAVAFVGVLLLLAVVARFVSRPKPILITAGPVDIGALRAAGESMAERPGPKPHGRKRSPSPDRPGSPPAPPAPAGPLDLNHATPAQLDALPGVSPTVAQRIVGRRDSVGRFERVEDLDPVKGVGPALIEKLRGKVVFR